MRASTCDRAHNLIGTQLIDRAVAVLRALEGNSDAGCRISDVAAAAELSVPTTHRIVAALERHGLVEWTGRPRLVRLGLRLFALGAAAADDTGLRRICRPALLRLAGETEETVLLVARSGLDTIRVDRQTGRYVVETSVRNAGGSLPLGVGSASLAIMAYLPPKELEAIIGVNTKRYAAYGVSVDTIRSHLSQCLRDGYVVTDGMLIEGIAGVAMPIRPPRRDVTTAIAINLTSARLTPAWKATLLQRLRDEVAQVEAQLSAPLPPEAGLASPRTNGLPET